MRSSRLIRALLCLALAGAAGANAQEQADAEGKDYSPFPNPDAGYVTDLAGLLDAEQEERIEQWLWQTEEKTRVEIIVVTIPRLADYPGTPNASIEEFGAALFDRYGIGNPPKNDGILLLVSLGDRKAQIELGAGYGRGRDADAQRIMNGVIVPRFRKGDYAGGITEGVRALMHEFAGVGLRLDRRLIVLIAAVAIVGLIAVSLFRNGKRGWGWVCVGLVIVLALGVFRLLAAVGRHMPQESSGGWSPRGSSGS